MQALVVDDDFVTRELLRNAMEASGFEALLAENGRQALEILRAGQARLVVTDWEMPEMDGLTLCQAIRAEELGRYVYVILLTCREGTSNVVEGLAAGADDFVSKPFEPSELSMRLRAGARVLSLETRDLAIFALAKLAESRDPETGGHLERVRMYSRELAGHLAGQAKFAERVDAGFIRLLYLTSPLHDVGKVGIPDHVLLKPGRLDDHEFEIMKTHTTQGAATLESALEQYPEAVFLRMARDIALSHHERYDGNGYPEGRAGEDIPLCARVFAVADVYDALVSKRVYKDAFTHDIAKGIILEGSGTQFDADVVEAFKAREAVFAAIRAQHRETAQAA